MVCFFFYVFLFVYLFIIFLKYIVFDKSPRFGPVKYWTLGPYPDRGRPYHKPT